jgi:hypothetical protein
MSEVLNILKELQSVEDDSALDILVPSVNKLIKFKPLSVKQHHEILKCSIDGVPGSIKLAIILNKIIIDNSLEPVDFTIYDAEWILLQLRKHSFGKTVSIEDKVYNLDDLTKNVTDFKYTHSISYKGIEVLLSVPTIKLDIEVSEACYKDILKTVSDETKISETISSMLSYEIVKFIKSISVKDNTINFSDITTTEKKKLLESIPLAVNNKITEYISSYRKNEISSYTFSDGALLTIDGDFLTRA